MDPSSKRFLWNTIISMFKGSNRGAMLTTHSMEEADALCSRIAIMIQGAMKCIGSSQHIKDKHGSGYQLEVKLKPTKVADLHAEEVATKEFIQFVQQTFVNFHGQESEPSERFGGRLIFKVPKECVESLGSVFEALESRKQIDIEEFSFSQSTLEQVFLDFAKLQVEEQGVL